MTFLLGHAQNLKLWESGWRLEVFLFSPFVFLLFLSFCCSFFSSSTGLASGNTLILLSLERSFPAAQLEYNWYQLIKGLMRLTLALKRISHLKTVKLRFTMRGPTHRQLRQLRVNSDQTKLVRDQNDSKYCAWLSSFTLLLLFSCCCTNWNLKSEKLTI